VLPRESGRLRAIALAAAGVVAAGLLATVLSGTARAPAEKPAAAAAPGGQVAESAYSPATLAERRPAKAKDARKRLGLFVDPLMPAHTRGGVYRKKIGKRAQAFWVIPEDYGTHSVRRDVRAYTRRALDARKTPVLTIYGIPGRDCGFYSSNNPLKTAKQYRKWIRKVAKGLRKQKAMVILEPDALPFFSSTNVPCSTKPDNWQGMLRYATKRLSRAGAWVYLDAGHSNWTPYDTRPSHLKQAGVKHARGIATNVSNFRPLGAEKRYATELLRGLRKLGITGKKYVVDTSRNGVAPVDGRVINPPWARVGKPPKLRFRGAFDGTLWVKHPGESDGTECRGPASGHWSDLLADRLLGRTSDTSC